MKKGSPGGIATAIILRKKALNRYYKKPNICKNCNSIIEVRKNEKVSQVRRRKFCNSSCSTSYNNKTRIKHNNLDLIIKVLNNFTDCFENKSKKEVFEKYKTWQAAKTSKFIF